jgi:hypothetical protein
LTLKLIVNFAVKSWVETAGVANHAGEWKIFEFITFRRVAV